MRILEITKPGIPRSKMPQIHIDDIKDKFKYKLGKISLDKMTPVQTERLEKDSIEAKNKILSGTAKPIMLDKLGNIVNGHHRYDAYKELGHKKVPAVLVDATLSELMQTYSDTVEENFADGKKTMEVFDKPYKSKTEKSEFGDIDVLAKLPDGTNLSIMFNNEGNNEWQVEFYRNNSQEVTGEGDAQRIFATVLNAIQRFIKKQKPQLLKFSASKEVEPGQNSESRAKLYNRLVQRYANAWGYEMYQEDHGDQVTYELTPLRQGLATENFADGKVKGKSRPGRVKRAGASCAGSVTDLRKRAKNASGEKQKMLHWCANMKSGKKK